MIVRDQVGDHTYCLFERMERRGVLKEQRVDQTSSLAKGIRLRLV